MAWTVAAIIMLAYVCVFVWLSPLLQQDYPNHLARAVVIGDLVFHDGSQFGRDFAYHFLAVPYILGDLVLVASIELFGVKYGAALSSALTLLSLSFAVLFYMRAAKVPRDGQILVFMLSMYLATNWFFMMGFFAFSLAIAATIVCLGLVELFRQRSSTGLFVTLIVVLVLAYLIHVTAILFLAAAVGISAVMRLWFRTTSLKTEALIFLPIAALLAWNAGIASRNHRPGDLTPAMYDWGTVFEKFQGLAYPFRRFSLIADGFLLLALAVRHSASRQALARPRVLEMFALTAGFLGIYVVLPLGYVDAWFVDIRALPFAIFFFIMGCMLLPDDACAPRRLDRVALPLAALLVVANLVYLTLHLRNDSAWLSQYRAVVAAVPRGSHVLPIFAHTGEGKLRPALHAGSFIVVDRGGVIPYLFSGDRGNPMKYFRYLHRPYAPYEEWYLEPVPARVDWVSVACDYDFLLAMKPFDARRIGVSTKTVFENGTAALLAVARQPCEGPLGAGKANAGKA